MVLLEGAPALTDLGETRLELEAALAERGWLELLGGQRFGGWHEVALAALPLGMGVFYAPSAAPEAE